MAHGEQLSSEAYYDTHTLKLELMKYFNVMKDCGWGYDDAETACIPSLEVQNKSFYKNYNKTGEMDTAFFDDGQFVLTDGSLILLENFVSEQKIYISVDVNGFNKKPNVLGRDLFMFQLMQNGTIKPMGAKGTDYPENNYCSKTSTNRMNGAGCTQRALQEK